MGYHMQTLIYRQEAIDAMHQYSYFNDFDISVIDEDLAVIALKDLPSVQPYQWVSCTDRLPEYGEGVLTVNEDGDYEVNHIIDEDNGEWFYEGPIAWTTLPPYKEE